MTYERQSASAKIKLAIIFGGRSSEHDVSVLSAAAVLSMVDRSKYEPIPFLIDKEGCWHLVETSLENLAEISDPRIPLLSNEKKVSLTEFDSMTDFAFPILHGPFGEDGTIQGLFEMMDKPYAGCGVTAASISMDKILTKDIWKNAGLPVSNYTYTTRRAVANGFEDEVKRIEKEIAYPIFIKPANMGSSVGVTKADDRAGLESAIELALKYDRRVIAEETVFGRELEVGVIGNETPKVSAIGEILAQNEYYDFDSKYKTGDTELIIPANLPVNIKDQIEKLAIKAFCALDGEGFSRMDLFYDEKQEKVYLNEMNAIPGFTRYSMFPLLWQAKGVGFEELIERIIDFGYERHNASHYR